MTYYEIENPNWSPEAYNKLIQSLLEFGEVQNIFSRPLNELDYNLTLIPERERYEIEHPNPELKNPEKSLKDFYGTCQTRALQPTEVYNKFQTIYKVASEKYHGEEVLITKHHGELDIPEELRETPKFTIVVALTTEGEFKTYLVDMRETEDSHLCEALSKMTYGFVQHYREVKLLYPEFAETQRKLIESVLKENE